MYILFLPPTLELSFQILTFFFFFLSWDNLSFLFNNRDVFGIILELILLAVKTD